MNCARNYENVLNFVKVMPKILLVPSFPDTVYKKLRHLLKTAMVSVAVLLYMPA